MSVMPLLGALSEIVDVVVLFRTSILNYWQMGSFQKMANPFQTFLGEDKLKREIRNRGMRSNAGG